METPQETGLIRNISDTALWTAFYRAEESKRRDKLFDDPFAEKLAGNRGKQIKESFPEANKNSWAFNMRTILFDQCIMKGLDNGVDAIVNMAAGLDARPYRLTLPPTLDWIEIDLKDLNAYKEEILKDVKPVCNLERISIDLSDREERLNVFESINKNHKKVLLLSEGLLIYLAPKEVGILAEDLSSFPSFHHWGIDITSPGLKEMMDKHVGKQLIKANAPFQFAPAEGPDFFRSHGWIPEDVHSVFKTAAKHKRLSFIMRFFALLPESKGKQGKRPWSAVCLLKSSKV